MDSASSTDYRARVNRVVMMAAFPPPIGGAAKISGIIHDALVAAAVDVTRIDLSATTLAHRRGLGYHAERLRRNAGGMLRAFAAGGSETTLYIVPDGGAGAWYTLAHLLAAGGRYRQIVIHHHTCRYVEHHSRPIAMMTRRLRDKATHVFLTPGMAEAFQRRYGPVEHVVASNARFVAEEAALAPTPRPAGPIRLGHLSNLCRDKGFFAVADAFDAARAAGRDVTLSLAGPVLEPEVGERIEALTKSHGTRVHHLGTVAGGIKRDFYRALDLFLFPTRWKQEAAPIVIYEARAAGVPVLATTRGMIPEIIGPVGAFCREDDAFTNLLLGELRDDKNTPAASAARARTVKEAVRVECDRSLMEYDRLLALLVGSAAPNRSVASS